METKTKKTKTKIEDKILQKDKMRYFKLGLGLAGISLSDKDCELFCLIYEQVIIKGNKFSVEDAIKCKLMIHKKDKKIKNPSNWDSHLYFQ